MDHETRHVTRVFTVKLRIFKKSDKMIGFTINLSYHYDDLIPY